LISTDVYTDFLILAGMIEVYFQQGEIKRFESVEELDPKDPRIYNVRIIDFTESELSAIADRFHLDLIAFKKKEDIELSSHYSEAANQLSLHFTIPNYFSENSVQEQDMYILIKNDTVFSFLSADIEKNLNQLTQYKYDLDKIQFKSFHELLVFQMGVISDYFADIVEITSHKIKALFKQTVQSKQFMEKRPGCIDGAEF
jgi:magnesium transporter